MLLVPSGKIVVFLSVMIPEIGGPARVATMPEDICRASVATASVGPKRVMLTAGMIEIICRRAGVRVGFE